LTHDDAIQNAGTEGIDWRLFRMERRGRLDALAEADAAAGARAEVVVNDYFLTVARPVLGQRLQAARHADDPPRPDQRRVRPRQRNGADNLSDAHGRPTPATRTPHPRDRRLPT